MDSNPLKSNRPVACWKNQFKKLVFSLSHCKTMGAIESTFPHQLRTSFGAEFFSPQGR